MKIRILNEEEMLSEIRVKIDSPFFTFEHFRNWNLPNLSKVIKPKEVKG